MTGRLGLGPKTAERLRRWRGPIALLLAGAVSLGVLLDLRSRTARIDAEIAELSRQALLSKQSGLADVGPDRLAQLQTETARFKQGFIRPSQIAALLSELSEQAEKHGVRVVAVRSGDPAPVALIADSGAAEAAPAGEAYERLPIHMRAQGTTRAIGDLLAALGVASQRIFVVESMRLSRAAGRAGALDCELTIAFFAQASEAA